MILTSYKPYYSVHQNLTNQGMEQGFSRKRNAASK